MKQSTIFRTGHWVDENTLSIKKNKLGGGLRIKKITDIPSSASTPKIRNFIYTDPDNKLKSSGIFNDNIKYTYTSYSDELCTDTYNRLRRLYCNNIERTSSSVLPISSIYYQYVTTQNGKNLGKTIQEYYTFDDVYKYYPKEWPFAKPTSYNWQNGILKESSDFKKVNGKYTIVQKNSYTYEFNNNPTDAYTLEPYSNLNNILATQVRTLRKEFVAQSGSSFLSFPSVLDVKVYWHISAWNYLKSHTNTLFDINSQSEKIKVKTIYKYDNLDHVQLTSQTSIDSEGVIVESKTKYPLDYTSPSSITTAMINKHMIANPIEQIQTVDGKATKATGTKYFIKDNMVLPKEVYSLETNIPLSNFNESTDGSTFTDYEKRLTYNKYDNKGNILEYSKTNDVHTSIIWGYNQTYPVAQISNATYAQIESALGVGFVSGTDGSEGLSDNQIDLLRTLPNVQVTTYTYKPLVGISTQTDPQGFTTYYEYDDFNRLKSIKDKDGNIVKNFEYHYRE